ncbi:MULTISPECIES: tetratricopeptide repeat protein [unclassified Thermosipho (in: thermotogales)]|uniref:tetratricopeptide repeat protein n=1 Tax=unclassified Thermosipho (in: thermotogales) TaxID=2676525 RepID=UPI0009848F6E|nr:MULTISPECIES: tetratricopeptide repeat protein [unclassified Thermosipho (in: thermotogales)]MBT1247456.1 hypothetical protein [Thermosipho sp. 1244]OOC46293.1 hypothetical protein XO09_07750 [Thermosipho sp. 1223]
MKKISAIFILFFVLAIFGFQKEAIEYYQAGLNAYQQDNYKKALEYFEKALILDPSIEGYDNSLKFKTGISAFMIGNYDKAKAYLSNYKDNPIIGKLLNSIQKESTETSEWSNWIKKYHPTEVPVSTNTTNNKSNFKLILFLITFSLSFTILLFMEIRVWKAKKTYPVPVEEIKPEPMKTPSIIVENTEELFPENTKATINFEDLINKDLSFLSEFFDDTPKQELDKEPEKLVENALESKNTVNKVEKSNNIKEEKEEKVEINNETLKDYIQVVKEEEEKEKSSEEEINEILEEIDEIEEIVSNSNEDKDIVENSLIEQLNNMKFENTTDEIPIERLEEFSTLSSDESLKLLDDKEEFDEFDLKIISKSLKDLMLSHEEMR